MTEKPKPEIDLVEQLAPDGFIMIRSGIREHIDGGRFLGFDLGVYLYLHAISSWKTGIAYTCAKAKFTHPNLRRFTFSTGETIEMCPQMLPVTVGDKIRWCEPATLGDLHRRDVLCFPKKFKLSASEFLDYELLLMGAKHLKHFQSAPSEVARCRF